MKRHITISGNNQLVTGGPSIPVRLIACFIKMIQEADRKSVFSCTLFKLFITQRHHIFLAEPESAIIYINHKHKTVQS